MKGKRGKRWLALGICAMLCIPANLQVYAQETEEEPFYGGIVESNLQPAKSIHETYEPNLLWSEEPLESYYMTEKLPAVKAQGPYGTCWAFSTIACMEIYLMNHPEAAPELSEEERAQIDLSELHTAYFSHNSVVDPLGGTAGDYHKFSDTNKTVLKYGGNYDIAITSLQDWMGAVDETTVPYSKAASVEINGLTDDLAYGYDSYHLQGYHRICMEDRDDVKQAVKDYGAVGIDYYAVKSAPYFNDTYDSYYYPTEHNTNHAVTIVGWDDNFDKTKFGHTPANNGAWIVRNSWGSDWGDGGYFYLSYEDVTIGSTGYAVQAESADHYKYNYQYDGAYYSIDEWEKEAEDEQECANVFTVQGSGAQCLEAVSFETFSVNQRYTICIFTNPTDPLDPETGNLAATLTGTTDYQGMYTISLKEALYLNPGDVFAVSVKLLGQDNSYGGVARDHDFGEYGYASSGGTGKSLARGQSGWYDFGASYNSNYHIKAYTNDAIPVSGVSVSTQQLTLQKGDTATLTASVSPQNASNPSVSWNSSASNVATVDGNGVVTAVNAGQAVIMATTVDGGYQATCIVSVVSPVPSVTPGSGTEGGSGTNPGTGNGSSTTPSGGTESGSTSTSAGGTGNGSSITPSGGTESGSTSTSTGGAGGNITPDQGNESGSSSSSGNSSKPNGGTGGNTTPDHGNEGGSENNTTSEIPKSGWVKEDNVWYYYKENGVKATGWLKDGGTWYYMKTNGAMVTGWVNDEGIWYYMNPSGAMATGWVNDGGTWYYMNPSGAMATGWVNDGGTWYYMKSSGAMVTGWVYSGGTWYYMRSSGAMATGWVYSGGHWYYMKSDGSMARNTRIGRYRIGANGVWK